MKHRYELESSYPDLLDEQADPTLVHLVRDLDAAYTAAEKPAGLSWATVKAQYNQTAKRTHPVTLLKWLSLPRKMSLRAAVVVSVLLVVLLGAGVVQADLVPLLVKVLNEDPATRSVLQSNGFINIHQSKTVNGVTVSVEKAYADQNRVIVGYTVTTSSAYITPAFISDLTTDQGVTLRPFTIAVGLDAYQKQLRKGATVMSFDASAITGNPAQLHLHLSFSNMVLCGVNGPRSKGSTLIPVGKCEKLAGAPTLTFDFTVPFHPGKVITLNQTRTAGGKTLTLERVVITPSATVFYIRGMNPITSIDYFGDSLSIQGKSYNEYSLLGRTNNQELSFTYLDSLTDQHGQWTFEIKPDCSNCGAKGGPWVFQFIVP